MMLPLSLVSCVPGHVYTACAPRHCDVFCGVVLKVNNVRTCRPNNFVRTLPDRTHRCRLRHRRTLTSPPYLPSATRTRRPTLTAHTTRRCRSRRLQALHRMAHHWRRKLFLQTSPSPRLLHRPHLRAHRRLCILTTPLPGLHYRYASICA
jgi:hypothetical protein